jgi:hypothetical protein
MDKNWYPESVRVGPEGTPATYEFLTQEYATDAHFTYAELGIYNGDTARNVCERFPNCTLYLFDFESTVQEAGRKLASYENRIFTYGNTQKYNDSYNWPLMKLLNSNRQRPLFDYVFLDGAHTFAIDALSYFLCDLLLRPGGFLDFDDYGWRLRGSSLDPTNIPEITEQYTEEQIDSFQVKLVVDGLVRTNTNYREVVENKIFQKIS